MLPADALAFIDDALGFVSAEQNSVQAENVIADMVAWIERDFWIPERMAEPEHGMKLVPYQRAVLREAERRAPATGKFVYDLVLWSDIKKSAKSTIAAAVILYRALNTPYGSFKIVANDLKQADSRVFYYIRRALELNPALAVRATVKNYKIALDNKATIEAVPVDPSGEAGGNDDFIEFTELHAASSKASLRMWSEMTIPPTKYGYAQRWIDTYAGHSGEAPILEQLYESGVKGGVQLTLPDAPADLEVYAAGSMLVLWNTTPRMTEWQTPAYYASEAVTLLPAEFQRIHRNQWVTSENVFVQAEWWDACKGELPPLPPGAPIVVGVDAAITGDCFAVVGVSRIGEHVYTRLCRIWKPPKGGAIDYGAIGGPEEYMRQLARDYNVLQFAYDPYQLHDMATRMKRDGAGWWRSFSQATERLVADKQLYDAIVQRSITWQGFPDLSEHVKNANSKAEGDKTLRIVKRAEHLKIDACVALSMAHSEIKRLNVG